jgi:hypothetical protein
MVYVGRLPVWLCFYHHKIYHIGYSATFSFQSVLGYRSFSRMGLEQVTPSTEALYKMNTIQSGDMIVWTAVAATCRSHLDRSQQRR